MAERRRIRIRSEGEPFDTVLTDEEGRPIEAMSAAILVKPDGITAAVEFYGPQVDIIADLAGLERLAAAEEVASAARHWLRTVSGPKRPNERDELHAENRVRAALIAWEPLAGIEHNRTEPQ